MVVDLDAKGLPIHLACRANDASLVRDIVKARRIDIEDSDVLGDTPLLKAVRYKALDCVKVLIAGGASTQARDEQGWTCLHIVAANGHLATFRLLLDVGAVTGRLDVEARTEEHEDTPLHFATYHDREEMVKELLRNGADPMARNANGQRPLEVVRSSVRIKDMLVTAMSTRRRSDDVDGGEQGRENQSSRGSRKGLEEYGVADSMTLVPSAADSDVDSGSSESEEDSDPVEGEEEEEGRRLEALARIALDEQSPLRHNDANKARGGGAAAAAAARRRSSGTAGGAARVAGAVPAPGGGGGGGNVQVRLSRASRAAAERRAERIAAAADSDRDGAWLRKEDGGAKGDKIEMPTG